MKLAEALIERKAIKKRIDELKRRIYQNSRIQEGDAAIEDPSELLKRLAREIEKFKKIIIRINKTNIATELESGITLMEAIVQKDMYHLTHQIHSNLADKATPLHDRYSQREIKLVPNVDITDVRDKADKIAVKYRKLDMQIQEANWLYELI